MGGGGGGWGNVGGEGAVFGMVVGIRLEVFMEGGVCVGGSIGFEG